VLGLMNSCAAISWLVGPSAARREICASLGGQVVTGLDGPFAGVLAGRLELDPGSLGRRFHAELRESLVGGSQLIARVAPAALAAQPFAVQEMTTGELDADAGAGEALDRLAIERLGGFPVAQQRPRARLDAERPVGATGRGCLRKLAEGIQSRLRLPAPDGRLDQLDRPIIAPPRGVSVLAGLLRLGERLLVMTQTVMEHSRHPSRPCSEATHRRPRGYRRACRGPG
jgi:hypothetical protein